MLELLVKLSEWLNIATPGIRSVYNLFNVYDELNDEEKKVIMLALFKLCIEIGEIHIDIVDTIMLQTSRRKTYDTSN